MKGMSGQVVTTAEEMARLEGADEFVITRPVDAHRRVPFLQFPATLVDMQNGSGGC